MKRLRKTVHDSLKMPSGIKSRVPEVGSGKAVKNGLMAAGGLAALTAGSAGISSLRRRWEGATEEA